MTAVKMFAEGVTQQIKEYLSEEYQNVESELCKKVTLNVS